MAPIRKVYEEYAKSVYRFLLSLTESEDWAKVTFFRAKQKIIQEVQR